MFMLLFICVIVCGILLVKIQSYAYQKGCVVILLTTTFVCLFHGQTWISNVICRGLFCVLLFELRRVVHYFDIRWPLIFEDGLEYKPYVTDVLDFTETERILEAGMNVNYIFARGDFKGNLLAIRLDASIS